MLRLFRTRVLLAASTVRIAVGRLPTKPTTPAADAQSIIVFRLDELGDVILISAFLAQLRAHFPAAHIALVTKAGVAAAVDACPHVDEVIPYDAPLGSRALIAHLTRPIAFGRLLGRSRRYDLAINARWDKDSYGATVMGVFAGARSRVAFAEDVNEEKAWEYKGFDKLSTHIAHADRLLHEVEKLQRLFPAMGMEPTTEAPVLEYWSPATSAQQARAALDGLGITVREPYVVVCPSYGHSKLKAWPTERFVELIAALRLRYRVPIVLAGSDADSAVASEIVAAVRDDAVVSLCGALPLGASAELIRSAKLFVGCDSGLSHIAAAVGTPLVALFGSSCSHRFHPWSAVARTIAVELPCGPCAGAHVVDRCSVCIYASPLCMESIAVEQVLAAVGDQIGVGEIDG